MTIRDAGSVDLLSIDASGEVLTLSLVAEEPWGTAGALVPALTAKLTSYVRFVRSGQLLQQYPDVAGKSVVFCLHYADPPGPAEEAAIRQAVTTQLGPHGIGWAQRPIPD